MLETPILTALRQFRPWLPRGLVPPATPVEEEEPAAASEAPDLSQEAGTAVW
ncbi:MAG: hypothetical protein IT487_10910 [Chromatiaceae bacterium]|nr:hypothetical protein [Chromatiaceae bacterium]